MISLSAYETGHRDEVGQLVARRLERVAVDGIQQLVGDPVRFDRDADARALRKLGRERVPDESEAVLVATREEGLDEEGHALVDADDGVLQTTRECAWIRQTLHARVSEQHDAPLDAMPVHTVLWIGGVEERERTRVGRNVVQ